MRKDNFYRIIIICLLLLNISMLVFMWTRHVHTMGQGGHEGPGHIIIERLKLDEQQQQQFEVLKQEHHSQMMGIQETDGKLHDQLFNLLQKEPVDTTMENMLLHSIMENNMKREQVTFEHFRKIKEMLRPDQKALFDTFVADLGRIFAQPPNGRGPMHDGPPPPHL